jgi:hypothetical protein
MESVMIRQLVGVVALLICSSCCLGPKVTVLKNPSDCEEGIRYYRPKPYLLVTPTDKTTVVEKTTVIEPGTSPNAVQIKLQYLPDFTEEYAIQVDPGIGIVDVSIQLQDGWNLVGINEKLDSNFDDNLKAISDLTKTVGGLKTAGEGSVKAIDAPPTVVPATNVPLGYYESVIGRDSCGRKRMFGWRYLGFMPYAACPVDMCGSECRACGDPSNAVYGLVFVNGIMTFREIGTIACTGDPQPQVVQKADDGPIHKRSIELEASTASAKAGGTGEVDVTVEESYVVVDSKLPKPERDKFATNFLSTTTIDALKALRRKVKVTGK